ncbi:sensor histidine kinase [Rhizomonospora bruguierae]|uniref:sensor histidine kinase n=1 Tax=Rhizomonospora bruguierae TaxID=1581705 RepID=UPI0020BE4C6A|nr:sensor histidine kinase [Micromonospora sp. NBRC 107566]
MTTLCRPLVRWHAPAGAARLMLADGLLAAGVVAVEVLLTATVAPGQQEAGLSRVGRDLGAVGVGAGPYGGPLWLVALYSVLAAAPIVLRRVALRPAALLAVAGLAIPAVVARYPLSQIVTFVMVTYSAAAALTLRRAVLAAVVLWVPALVVSVLTIQPEGPHDIGPPVMAAMNVLIALVCFFIGRTVCARRAYTQALEERARSAEANQRSLAAQAVADERRRIARELHDVVAHHVSVMGVLATGARRVLHKDPAATDEALGTIEDTSRTTLREMRRLLDVLRTEAEPAADLAPQPGLAGIEALVEQVREAGLPVALAVDGVPSSLDPGVALTIFRIVQEALTNTLKHAGEATAQVRLAFGVYWLIVEIFDTGRGPAPRSEHVGHGLVGMRERVALYGGTLRTGPRPGGGYRVYAKIPMEQLGVPVADTRRAETR